MIDRIANAANAIDLGVDTCDILAYLKAEGLSDGDAYLTFIAGNILSQSRWAETEDSE